MIEKILKVFVLSTMLPLSVSSKERIYLEVGRQVPIFRNGYLRLGPIPTRSDDVDVNVTHTRNALVKFHRSHPKTPVRALHLSDFDTQNLAAKKVLNRFIADHGVKELDVITSWFSTPNQVKMFALSLPKSVKRIRLTRRGFELYCALGAVKDYSSVVLELQRTFNCQQRTGVPESIMPMGRVTEAMKTELVDLTLTRLPNLQRKGRWFKLNKKPVHLSKKKL